MKHTLFIIVDGGKQSCSTLNRVDANETIDDMIAQAKAKKLAVPSTGSMPMKPFLNTQSLPAVPACSTLNRVDANETQYEQQKPVGVYSCSTLNRVDANETLGVSPDTVMQELLAVPSTGSMPMKL